VTRGKKWAMAIGFLLAGGAAAGLLAFLQHGFSARAKPWAAEEFIARRLRHLAIPGAARQARIPIPLTAEVLAEARAHFGDHCASCHANDGSGETQMGRSMYPPAPDMRLDATQELSDGELFYIIENGVRFTGMPAWGTESTDDDRDTWGLVRFIRRLPALTPEELAEMESLNPKSRKELEEEEEIRRFLAGEDLPDAATRHKH